MLLQIWYVRPGCCREGGRLASQDDDAGLKFKLPGDADTIRAYSDGLVAANVMSEMERARKGC